MKFPSKLLCALVATACLAGCAFSPVKPLYPSEAARLSKIELRVAAPKEAMSVDQLVNATVVYPSSGVYAAPGLLPTVIAAGIAGAIVQVQLNKNADELRPHLTAISNQVAGVDYSLLVGKRLEEEFASAGTGRVSTVLVEKALTPAERSNSAKASGADAILFVDVTRSFTNGVSQSRLLPVSPSGMQVEITADVTLVSREGGVLLKDSIVFEPPRSLGGTMQERVAWWREHDRYRHLLERSGPALAAALRQQVFGQAAYPDEAAFNAQRDADIKVRVNDPAAQSQRVDAALRRFRNCDDFYKVPLAETRFELYRASAEDPLFVGVVCGASPAGPATVSAVH